MSPFSALLAGPSLVVRALDDLHRIAQLGDQLGDLSNLSASVDELATQLAAVDRRLASIEGFDKDLDRLGSAARELTRTMVLLRKSAENVTLSIPGSQLVARRAGRRRAASRAAEDAV